jgi:hypothetical protein
VHHIAWQKTTIFFEKPGCAYTSTIDNLDDSLECLSDNITNLNRSGSAFPVENTDYF